MALPPAPKPAPAPVGASGLLSWKLAYFYDEDGSSVELHDLQFPGPQCAVAVGTQSTKGKGSKPVAVRSVDGGKTWSLVPLKNHARSAFFLSERLGWIVTEDGVERSSDCGASWERVGKEKGLVRAWFLDEALGWAVGGPKKAMTTRNGGKSWTPIKVADEPKSDPERSVYAWVEFSNEKFGVISGWHTPLRRNTQFPVWMDPESALFRRQWPSLTLLLQTNDGGSEWKGFTASLMGRVTRLRLAPNGTGLALIEFDESFDYASEVFQMGLGQAQVKRIYREKHHAVTDLAVARDNWAYLAGVQTAGVIRLPVPGKVKILRSRDRASWIEDPVDYRATATRVVLATSPQDGQVMAATDTGMILRLQ